MTTGINPDNNPVARRWAATLLGVPENASGGEARRAYFKKLRDSDFLPPRSLPHAFRILDGKTGPAERDEEWLLEEESRLHAEVESFAAKFFALHTTQRRERWGVLASRCETALPLTARLQALKAGLEVKLKSLPSGQFHQGRLAKQLLLAFPLPPLAQAASRQAFLRQIEEPSAAADYPSWEKAARYLLAEWPALAALDRALVQHIAKLRSRLKRRSGLHQRGQRQRRAPVPVGKKGKTWWPLLMIAVAIFGGIMRALEQHNSSPSAAPSSTYSPASSLQSVLAQQPLIQELFDPSKFDVEIVDPPQLRVLRFTPRPGSTITGPNGPKANNGQPLLYGEAILRLQGVSQEQINALFARAAKEKRPDDAPKTPPAELGPNAPKSTQGNSARP